MYEISMRLQVMMALRMQACDDAASASKQPRLHLFQYWTHLQILVHLRGYGAEEWGSWDVSVPRTPTAVVGLKQQ